MWTKQALLVGTGLVLGIGIGVGIPRANAQGAQPKPGQRSQSVMDFPDLVGGLKATPGCLDAREGLLNQGKTFAIYAWFKNKAAVEAWYNGPMHRGVMAKFFPGQGGPTRALEHFKDTKSPLLVVATITPGKAEQVAGSRLAISQIAIEIYTPVPGGIQVGGGFGPPAMEVPFMKRLPATN